MKHLRRIVGLCIAAVLILPVASSADEVKQIQLWNKTTECVRFMITNMSSRVHRPIEVRAGVITGHYAFPRAGYSIYIESTVGADCAGPYHGISNTIYLDDHYVNARASYYGGHNGLTYLEHGTYPR